MKRRKPLCGAIILGFLTFTPSARADPDGDAPPPEPDPPLAEMTCANLDNYPSVQGVRHLMANYTGFMLNQNVAWETIVNGMAARCPEHADLLREYARFYGTF